MKKRAYVEGSDAPCPSGPRLPILMIVYIFLGLIGYTVYMMRVNEPSSRTNKPTTMYFNEGGEECFAKDSMWSKIKNLEKNVTKIEDFFQLGGATAKSLLTFENEDYKAIWKPQLEKYKKHRDSSFFEVIYFHVDCLLELRRTPPAVSFYTPYNLLVESLTEASKEFYDRRNANWKEWEKEERVPGVAQYFLDDIKHLNVFVEKFGGIIRQVFDWFGVGDWIMGRSDYSLRELAQRDMIDYITGNWDRAHNRFYSIDPITGDTVLVYLDHNHLRLSTKNRPFELKICKYWKHTIDKLREYEAKGMEKMIRDSLDREDIADLGLKGKFENPLLSINRRTLEFLEHVDLCVDLFGASYVFGSDPIDH